MHRLSADVRNLGAAWRAYRLSLPTLFGAAAVALLIGIPTDVVPNPWFTRMTPIYADQYIWWVATSLLTGALLATYFSAGAKQAAPVSGIGGGLLGYLAIGCPICNKLIVGVLGVSGALNYFAPIQPALGALAVLLGAIGLVIRLRILGRGCPLPRRSAPAAPPP